MEVPIATASLYVTIFHPELKLQTWITLVYNLKFTFLNQKTYLFFKKNVIFLCIRDDHFCVIAYVYSVLNIFYKQALGSIF